MNLSSPLTVMEQSTANSNSFKIFFLSIVDSNTCDKIRIIRARITRNNARNIDLRYYLGVAQIE